MSRAAPAVVVTCEHASRAVPAAQRGLFAAHERLLATHRGWDPGALELAKDVARALAAPLVAGRATRLLVDLNRPAGHRAVFSRITRALEPDARERLLRRHHAPHWERVRALVDEAIARRGRVVHLGVHSFTPVRDGRRRELEVGLLFDPRRRFERAVAESLRAAIGARAPRLRVRFNRPYLGTAAGLTTSLRAGRADARYAGIELEVNQRLVRADAARWRAVRSTLAAACADALG